MILLKFVFVLAPTVFRSTAAVLDLNAMAGPELSPTEKHRGLVHELKQRELGMSFAYAKDTTPAQLFIDTQLNHAIDAEKKKPHENKQPFDFKELEKKANSVLMVLKNYENELNMRWPHRIPDNIFDLSKYMMKQDFFKLFKEMPKFGFCGHPTTMATVDLLAGLATKEGAGEENYKHIYVKHTQYSLLDIKGFKVTTEKLSYFDLETNLRFTKLQDMNSKGFPEALKKLLTLKRNEQHRLKNNAQAWDAFNAMFDVIGGLINCKNILPRHLKNIFEVMVEDNIQYVEIKATLSLITDIDGKEITALEAFDVYKEACREFEKERLSRKAYFKCKLIYTPTYAAKDVEKQYIFDTYRALLERDGTDGFLIGMGWVGPEKTIPMVDFYIPEAKAKLKSNTNLFLYAGQTNFYGSSEENLRDAIELRSKRIGHAHALPDHPYLMQLVKDRDICIETCPTVNDAMNLNYDFRTHPIRKMLAFNVPFMLSSNNPSIFEINPLTDDLCIAFVYASLYHHDLRIVKKIVTNSIKYSGLTDDEKKKAIAAWFLKYLKWLEDVAKFNGDQIKILRDKIDWLRMQRDPKYAFDDRVKKFASIEEDEKDLKDPSLHPNMLELLQEFRKYEEERLASLQKKESLLRQFLSLIKPITPFFLTDKINDE